MSPMGLMGQRSPMQLIVFVRNIVLGESDESKESNESHGTEESDGSDESNGSEESKESDGSVGSDECRDVSTLYKGRAGLLTRVGFFLRRTSMPQQRAATRAYTCPPDRMPPASAPLPPLHQPASHAIRHNPT